LRLICWVSGGCKWRVIKEEWVEPTKDRPFSQLVRHHECVMCLDTKATLTSPRSSESLFCVPDEFNSDIHEVATAKP